MLNRALLNRSLSFVLLLSVLQIPIFPAQANEVSGNGAYKLIDLQAARDAGIDGTGWVIASIDTGVQTDNPYIKDAILDDGYCFASGNGCSDGSSEMSGPGAGASAKNSDGTWRKDTTHGTATAGVAVGRPNKNALGGVAPGAKFFPINNQGNKNNLDFGGVLKGLERIYELRNKYKFAAIYISQGGWASTRSQFNNCNSQFKQEAEIISKLRKEGIPVIVASGNGSNTDGVNSISCVEDAISVGGVNSDGTIHYQSNIGSKVELLSPYCSNSSDYPENYGEFCGTSGSAPLVAGTFALMRQANPSLSVEEILKILKKQVLQPAI
jgi:subtilisin family serine protease